MRYWILNKTYEMVTNGEAIINREDGKPVFQGTVDYRPVGRNTYPHTATKGWSQHPLHAQNRLLVMTYMKAKDFIAEMELCE